MATTKHTIQLPGHTDPLSIHLTTTPHTDHALPKDAPLSVLSIVDVAQIPLHIIVGPHYDVATEDSSVARYFENILLSCSDSALGWWQTAQPESNLGILAAVDGGDVQHDKPRITEILFVASRIEPKRAQRLPTPPASSPHGQDEDSSALPLLQVRAIPLSSDLLYSVDAPTPPLSPVPDDANTLPANFLPDPFPSTHEVIHEPPTKKRRTATSTLDEATERRKAARKAGGESVSAAASSKSDPPPFVHRRSTSGSGPVPLQTRPLSRSPSIASSRPGSVRGPTPAEGARRSTLSRVQSVSLQPPAIPEEADLSTKNKDVISRIVMAGMRLYGFSQSRKRSKPRASFPQSLPESPALDASTADELSVEKRQDEEYKLLYHQVFKGTCFTFRQHIGAVELQPHTEALRNTVDKLLTVFCCDPLIEGLPGAPDKLTPGGRKAFGSAKAVEEKSPFAAA